MIELKDLLEGIVNVEDLTPEIINRILHIEKQAYPEHMQIMNQYVDHDDNGEVIYPTAEDLADYMECSVDEIILYVGTDWYIMGCDHGNVIEIVDWASLGGMNTLGSAKAFINFFKRYTGRIIEANLKHDTSYQFVKNAAEKGYIKIISDEINYWGNVQMHEVRLKVL